MSLLRLDSIEAGYRDLVAVHEVSLQVRAGEVVALIGGNGAGALMACPRLLLLDEPSLGLAPVMVKLIFETLATINTDGTTILLVEQNVARALALAHRAYVLENGRIVLDGPRAALQQSEHVKQAYLGL